MTIRMIVYDTAICVLCVEMFLFGNRLMGVAILCSPTLPCGARSHQARGGVPLCCATAEPPAGICLSTRATVQNPPPATTQAVHCGHPPAAEHPAPAGQRVPADDIAPGGQPPLLILKNNHPPPLVRAVPTSEGLLHCLPQSAVFSCVRFLTGTGLLLGRSSHL